MNERLTEMVFVLDKSGSMSGLESDTIGGFNSLIEKQKLVDGEAYVSMVLFNQESEVVYDRVPLQQIRPMTREDYIPTGCTALIDALGGAIHHIGNVHKYAREEDRPFKTVFVIMTDGMENASHKYTSAKVKEMITRQKEKYGWEFLFLAANIDAVETAATYGIDADRAVKYRNDPMGQAVSYHAVDSAIRRVRGGVFLSPDWKEDVEKDTASRGK